MSKKTTFYSTSQSGGIEFKTSRRIGDVRIPNFVYDMWLPIIGSDALAIYGVYCRLEMRGYVKKMTLSKIAKACRIGKAKLSKINTMLEDCGFAIVTPPKGHERLQHYSTSIEVLDPPQKVSPEMMEKYGPKDYELLTPWLADEVQTELPEEPNGSSDGAKQNRDGDPNGSSNIEALELQPLIDEEPTEKIPENGGQQRPPLDPAMNDAIEMPFGDSPKRDPAQDLFQAATAGQVSETTAPNPDDQWLEYGDKVPRLYSQQTGIKLNQVQKGELSLLTGDPQFNWQKFKEYLEAFAVRGGYAYNVKQFVEGYFIFLENRDIDKAMGRDKKAAAVGRLNATSTALTAEQQAGLEALRREAGIEK